MIRPSYAVVFLERSSHYFDQVQQGQQEGKIKPGSHLHPSATRKLRKKPKSYKLKYNIANHIQIYGTQEGPIESRCFSFISFLFKRLQKSFRILIPESCRSLQMNLGCPRVRGTIKNAQIVVRICRFKYNGQTCQSIKERKKAQIPYLF